MDIGGSDAAPVWCNPRPRDETSRHPRAEREAGTRRTQVRWHQPTDIRRINRRIFTGSISSDGQHHPEALTCRTPYETF
jgi:hypothetical protein